jgi:hypothetical protein
VKAKQEVAMFHYEMTISDVLEDPLIRQVMRADRVSLSDMEKLLLDAAEAHRPRQAGHYTDSKNVAALCTQ